MTNNTILQKIQFALHLTPEDNARIFAHVSFPIEPAQVVGYFIDRKHEDMLPCPNNALAAFLEGLIIDRRGVNEKNPTIPEFSTARLDNNDVLKKLRIAMDFHGEDVSLVLERAKADVHPNDLSNYFRKKGHKHYKVCPDDDLVSFLLGIRLCFKPKSR